MRSLVSVSCIVACLAFAWVSCGSTTTTTTECNAQSCATGCCDASGTCQPGSSDKAVCGKGGAQCGACQSSQSCVSGTCTMPTAPRDAGVVMVDAGLPSVPDAGSPVKSNASPQCEACINTDCTTPYTECLAEGACVTALNCSLECPISGDVNGMSMCIFKCATGSVSSGAGALLMCMLPKCNAECRPK